MRISVGPMGLPTEPMRRCISSFGMTMNAGPASLIPNEFETVASGSRSMRVTSVAGAIGALPTETCCRLDRSAVGKRSWTTISSANDGTSMQLVGRIVST